MAGKYSAVQAELNTLDYLGADPAMAWVALFPYPSGMLGGTPAGGILPVPPCSDGIISSIIGFEILPTMGFLTNYGCCWCCPWYWVMVVGEVGPFSILLWNDPLNVV